MRKLEYEEIKSRRHSADSIRQAGRFPVYVVLENIRSMYNVGAAFRTSDAACVEELILCGYTARPPRKEIEKTALGATDTVPWSHFANGPEAVAYLKAKGVTVIALEHCEESEDIMEMECPFPIALVIGNEVEGITPQTIAECDRACEIPMFGTKQSLNAAVAYGIAVFQFVQKYRARQAKDVYAAVKTC